MRSVPPAVAGRSINTRRLRSSRTHPATAGGTDLVPNEFLMTTIKPVPVKPTISIDLLDKIDIRAGTIKLVEDVKDSDKLVKLTVDFGDHTRTILVGMKQEREDPKQIEGRQTLFVINLEPKKIMGQVSEGMLLDIGYADGIKPVLALPEAEVPNGARAG